MARAAAKKVGPSGKVAKVSVSLPEEDEAWVRARAEKEQRPFSAVLGDIVTQARRDAAWRDVLAERLEKPLDEVEIERAEREIAKALAQPKRRASRR